MGKFCVKAAIVSSLAIAEEDYDNTVGAPIVLKRNLVARSLKEPEIPSDASIRALELVQNNQDGGCMGLGKCFKAAYKMGDLGYDKILNQAIIAKKAIGDMTNDVTDFSDKADLEKEKIVGSLQQKAVPFKLMIKLLGPALVAASPDLKDPVDSVTDMVKSLEGQLAKLKSDVGNSKESLVKEIEKNLKKMYDPMTTLIRKLEHAKIQTASIFNASENLSNALRNAAPF